MLAPTGYEGLLGERVNDHLSPGLAGRVARAKALAARLRATGWTFASHSYGHIDVARDSAAIVTRDGRRFRTQADPILGPTDVFVFPFGAAPATSSPQVQALKALGYRILLDIDDVPRLVRDQGITTMSRRHIDGIAFASPQQVRGLRGLFSVAAVEDRRARRP